MTLSDLIFNLNMDLSREYAHWHFYINAAIRVTGFHREELREFFLEAAASEMKHIEEWGRLIVGLGGEPTIYQNDLKHIEELVVKNVGNSFSKNSPEILLNIAAEMEAQVVSQFVIRMDEAESLQENGGQDLIDGTYVQLFLEEQIMDSRTDLDNIREMLK